MTLFTITTQYDTDEETINFGTRAICETSEFIYESTTIATAQFDEEVLKRPKVVLRLEKSKPCLVINNSISIFDDENFTDVLVKYDFDYDIRNFCLSVNKEFLIIVLNNGISHCIHLQTGSQINFAREIQKQCNNTGHKIIKAFIDEESNVYFVLSDTSVYRFSNLEEDKLHHLLLEEKQETVNSFISAAPLAKVCEGKSYRRISYVEYGLFHNKVAIAMIGNDSIYLWSSETENGLEVLPDVFKSCQKVQFLEECRYLLCLFNDKMLHIVCCQTFISMKIHDDPVDDFTIVQDQARGPIQICILMDTLNETGKSNLQLISFPDMAIVFQIPVSPATYLVQSLSHCVNNFVYLEITSKSQLYEKILIKALSEGNPNHRLERLIRREKFEEAMEFAVKFGLNKNPIYRAKASLLVSRINPWVENTDQNADKQMLIDILENILDIGFIYECCTKVLIMDYREMREILLYAKNRIVRKIQESNNINEQNGEVQLLSQINDMLKRWDVFEILKCNNLDSNVEQDYLNQWLQFSKANMFEKCIKHLQMGQIEEASIIWSKRFASIMDNLTIEKVQRILDWIGQTADPMKIQMWLHHFIPTVKSILPNVLPKILSWVYMQILNFEASKCQPWPEVGIDFIHHFMSLLDAKIHRLVCYTNKNSQMDNSSLQDLINLSQALKDLKRIRDDHKLLITLEIFVDNPLNFVLISLNNVNIDNIPKLIDTFLRQYISDHSMDFDEVLATYLQRILNGSQDWWVWEEAPWERRLAVVITFFNDVEIDYICLSRNNLSFPQNRLKYTLAMLKKAPVPLSATMLSVVEASYKYNHDIVFDIHKEKNSISKKLLCKKYGYQEIGLCEELIYYIIKEDSTDSITDICNLTENNQDLQINAITRYLTVYINKGNVEKAFSILDHFGCDISLYCCEWVINYTEKIIEAKTSHTRHWIDGLNFVKSLLKKLSTTAKENIDLNQKYSSIDDLKALYYLQKEFEIDITLLDLQTKKKNVLSNYAMRLNNELKNKTITKEIACATILKIAHLLSITSVFAINLLYNNVKDIDILKYFILNEADYEYLCKLDNCNVAEYNKLLCNAMLNITDNNEIKSIVQIISSKLLDVCNEDDLNEAVFLLPWLNQYAVMNTSCTSYNNFECTNVNEKRDINWKLSPVYSDAAISSKELFVFFQKAFLAYLYYSDQDISGFKTNYIKLPEKDEIDSWFQFLPMEVENLKTELHDVSLIRLLRCLYSEKLVIRGDSLLLNSLQSVMLSNSLTLLEKVVQISRLDLYTGLVCLFTIPTKHAILLLDTIFKKYENHIKQHKTISELGSEFDILIDKVVSQYNEYKILHQWVLRLSKYRLTSKDIHTFLDKDDTIRSKLLKNLIDYFVDTDEDINDFLQLIRDYCSDFILDAQYYFKHCLSSILKSWKPEYIIITKEGKTEIQISEDKKALLENRCKTLVFNIQDKDSLQEYLTMIKTQINLYHYEVFLVIFNLLGEAAVTEYNYIFFLMQYTRVGKPTSREQLIWEQLMSDGCNLPPIAKYRLPYLTLKKELWNIIAPELNLRTYKQWLHIAPSLSLDKNNICVLSIKGSVDEILQNYHAEANDWNVNPKNGLVFAEIKTCINYMSGPKALEMSTAVLYHVMNKLPKGVDKVIVAKECYIQAQSWTQQSHLQDEQLKKKLQEIKSQYLQLSAEHILQSHGLREDKYMIYIKQLNPCDLIQELYNHDSIPLRYSSDILSQPDINAAANALSELFSVNILHLRLKLLFKWLRSNREDFQINDTYTENITDYIKKSQSDESNLNETDLLKACYLIKTETETNEKQFIDMLIGIGFENNDDYNSGDRYRALRILQTTIDERTLETLTKRDKGTFRKRVKSLMYLSELENLGLRYTVDKFDSLPKVELIQLLLKRCLHPKKALYLCFELCIDYDIYDLSLWKHILRLMKTFSMTFELRSVLPTVINKSMIIYLEEYILCWQLIVDESFNKLGIRPTQTQINECIETLKILQVCPMVYDLKFEKSLSCSFQSGQPWFAAALIPFLSNSKKTEILKQISQECNVGEVLDELKNLSLKGVVSALIMSKNNLFFSAK